VISAIVESIIRAGAFVRIALRDGPTVEGQIASDPDEPEFLRLDLLTDDDGETCEASLRLLPNQIEAVEVLPE
jgi:hypothetical protein